MRSSSVDWWRLLCSIDEQKTPSLVLMSHPPFFFSSSEAIHEGCRTQNCCLDNVGHDSEPKLQSHDWWKRRREMRTVLSRGGCVLRGWTQTLVLTTGKNYMYRTYHREWGSLGTILPDQWAEMYLGATRPWKGPKLRQLSGRIIPSFRGCFFFYALTI